MILARKFHPYWCLLLAAYMPAALGGADTAEQTYRFDNGSGFYGSSIQYQFDSRHDALYLHNGAPVSRFLLHRDYGPGTLHYGGTLSDDEAHYYSGVTVGSATVAYYRGKGESFSKGRNPLYQDLDQYFFHGGSLSSFALEGASVNMDLSGGLSAQLAATTVTAPQVEDRHGYYTGISNRYFEAGVFQFDRGGEKVGEGLNLGFKGRKLDLSYQEIRSDVDAHTRRVSIQWSATPWRNLSLEIEQARNDLFDRDNEQRIMLRFRKRLGSTAVLKAAAEQDAGEEEQKTGFGRAVAIGVGVGVAAVAVSSGSDDNDGARRFAERNQAAFAILNQVNPVSVRQNREHGGWIFRNADSSFGFTDPVAGTISSVNIGNPQTSVPNGTSANASYHTHGGPDPRFDNENFSTQDIFADNQVRVDGYLGTPAGFMKLHDFETGSISVVGRIAN